MADSMAGRDCEAFCDVLHEFLIERHRRIPCFRQGDALGQQPALGNGGRIKATG
jgi:hypothetical protein